MTVENTQSGRSIRVGIIGPGEHAREMLIPSILISDGMRLTGICSRNEDKARQLAARYQAEFATTDWNKIIDQVDLVVVTATPDVHSRIAQQCLCQGRHIFIEKPPAENLPRLKILKDIASLPHKPLVFVDFNFRFSTPYLELIGLMGGNSHIRSIDIVFLSSKPQSPMWQLESIVESYLYAVGIHAIDLALAAFGSSPQNIHAKISWINGHTFILTLEMTFDRDRVVRLQLGNCSNSFQFELAMKADDGSTGTLSQMRTLQIAPSLSGPRSGTTATKRFIQYDYPFLRNNLRLLGYRTALENFRNAILEERQSPSSLNECVATYIVIDEVVRELSANGQLK